MNAEREIVKPYLDKLKENISFLDTYDDIEVEDEFGNTNRTKYVDFYEVMETIDDLLSGEKTMTREEAIEIIKAYRERLTSSASNLLDSDIKAFDMAIEALEQEPCEDCISRQAVIDALTKTSGIRGDALKALYDLPPITSQPKMGRWIGDGNYICSCCKCNPLDVFLEPLGLDGGSYMSVPMKYCPNCGAKMVDPQESEE